MRAVTSFIGLCRYLFVQIPLVGRINEVPRDALTQAIYETVTTTLFASTPIWVFPLFGHFLVVPSPTIGDGLRRGEGLIYACVLLGPLIYVLSKRYGRFNLNFRSTGDQAITLSMSFPYGSLFLIMTSVTCIAAGSVFSLSQQVGQPGFRFNQGGSELMSIVMIVLSTAILFFVTAYRNMLESLDRDKANTIVETQPQQEKEFLANWLETKS